MEPPANRQHKPSARAEQIQQLLAIVLISRYVAPLTTEQRKTTLQAVVGGTNMIRSTLLLVVAAAIGGADAFAPVGMAARASTQLFMVSCYF
jgi:hypothetical protein